MMNLKYDNNGKDPQIFSCNDFIQFHDDPSGQSWCKQIVLDQHQHISIRFNQADGG